MLGCLPLVSVLVPVYNVERYIERCARSLFEQSYTNLQFVFIDDCSPDQSINILRQVISDYPIRESNVSIIRHEKNRGLAAARNTALSISSGDLICFVDSDDWLEPDAIELLAKKQEENGFDIVSGHYMLHFEDAQELLPEKKYDNKENMVLQMMQRTWDHCLAGRLIRKSLLVDNGLHWNEGLDLAEDRYMMPMISYYAESFALVDKCIYNYERRNTLAITANTHDKRGQNYNLQELRNLLLLGEFFNDKDTVYREECARCIKEQLAFILNIALDSSSKDDYDSIVRVIDSRNDEEKEQIGWKKKGLRARLLHHYWVMKLRRSIHKNLLS